MHTQQGVSGYRNLAFSLNSIGGRALDFKSLSGISIIVSSNQLVTYTRRSVNANDHYWSPRFSRHQLVDTIGLHLCWSIMHREIMYPRRDRNYGLKVSTVLLYATSRLTAARPISCVKFTCKYHMRQDVHLKTHSPRHEPVFLLILK